MAWNLRRIRVAKGHSQEALAFDASVDRGYISGIENKTFNPTVEILERLATALSVDVVELLQKPSAGAKEVKPLKAGRRLGG